MSLILIMYLLPANDQGQHDFKQTYIDCASSTLAANDSEVIILDQNNDKQHTPEDDVKEGPMIIGYPTQLKTVIETYPPQNMKR